MLTIANSTFWNNSASDGGGGIFNHGPLSVANSTFSANTSGEGGGGIENQTTAIIADTIIAGAKGSDVAGNFISLGFNLIGDSSGGSGFVASDLLGVNPLLGPLQDNGGPTETVALLPGSPAIDAGSIGNISTGITTDQRGAARVVFGGVDIGAYRGAGVLGRLHD